MIDEVQIKINKDHRERIEKNETRLLYLEKMSHVHKEDKPTNEDLILCARCKSTLDHLPCDPTCDLLEIPKDYELLKKKYKECVELSTNNLGKYRTIDMEKDKEIERLKSTLDEQAEFHKEELNQCQENFDAKHKIIENALKEFTVMDWNTTIKCTLFHLYELLGGN